MWRAVPRRVVRLCAHVLPRSTATQKWNSSTTNVIALGEFNPIRSFRWPRSAATTEDLVSAGHTRGAIPRSAGYFSSVGAPRSPGLEAPSDLDLDGYALDTEVPPPRRTPVNWSTSWSVIGPTFIKLGRCSPPARNCCLRFTWMPRSASVTTWSPGMGRGRRWFEDELGVRIPRAAGRHRALTRPTTRKTRRSVCE